MTAERVAAHRRAKLAERVRAIKAHYSIVGLLRDHRPDMPLDGAGRWLSTTCPFHHRGRGRDEARSLWIDTERGRWGCRTCGQGGDVVNLYAALHRISRLRDAIKLMAEALP